MQKQDCSSETFKKDLQRVFAEGLHTDKLITNISKLHGDASYRTYYRIYLSDSSTYIAMQMPKGKTSVSEEITNFTGTHNEPPFINVARYLKQKGIPVPDIFYYSEASRIMILEDLGDGLMASFVDGANPSTKLELYRKAVKLLVSIQQVTAGDNKDSCIGLQRSFDENLLNWEFDHFLEYGIEARFNLTMDCADLQTFKRETRSIAAKIKKFPYGFTHRDFQSRNIIVKDDSLYLIDFQDALLGPTTYDLVALTRDSYTELPDSVVDELKHLYAKLAGRQIDELNHEYDLITVQRKLKDAGRFVYIDRAKGNPNFLPYIPRSLNYAHHALGRLPEHSALFGVLRKYIPEWNA